MRDLDETDMEILMLLDENARRPFSDIGEVVGLSGPAVSDRVTRLQEAGVINRFTVDVDRSQLHAGVPVFVQVTGASDVDNLKDQIGDADAVEHIFVTADGDVWFYARAQIQNVRRWLGDLLAGDDVDYTVTLIDDVEWRPSLTGTSSRSHVQNVAIPSTARGDRQALTDRYITSVAHPVKAGSKTGTTDSKRASEHFRF